VKKLIYAIYVGFVIIMVSTFYMAFSTFDGLVEPGYYEKSKNFFEVKETEDKLGLAVSVPEAMNIGKNDFRAKLATSSGPLTGAKIELYVGDIKNMNSDMSFPLKETSPGVYETDVAIPYKGKWLMRLEIEHQSIRTERRWFVQV